MNMIIFGFFKTTDSDVKTRNMVIIIMLTVTEQIFNSFDENMKYSALSKENSAKDTKERNARF